MPLLDALRPQVVVEIGIEAGAVTAPLLDWATSHQAVVHAIDPAPTFDPDDVSASMREALRLYRSPSLEVLGDIADVDLALIDGDHNWYTVINELRTLERLAVEHKRQPPVVLVHDAGWPYARRDMYYAPGRIPAPDRHDHDRRAVSPGSAGLDEHGINGHLFNAKVEGGDANGVLTAVEDFVQESPTEWTLNTVPGLNGVALLLPAALYAENGRVRDFVDSVGGAPLLRAQSEIVESRRIELQIELSRERERGRTRVAELESGHSQLEHDLDTQARDLQDQRDEMTALTERAEVSAVETRQTQGELDVARADAEKWRLDHERLSRRTDDLESERTELESKGSKLGQDLEARVGELQALRDEMRVLNDRAEKSDARTEQTEVELDEARSEAERSRLDEGRLRRRVDELESERAELEQELQGRAGDVRDLRRQLLGLADEAEQARTKVEQAQADISLAEERLAERDHLDDQRAAEGEEIRERLADRERELTALESRLQQSLSIGRRHEQEIAEVREALESQIDNASSELHRAQQSEQLMREERSHHGAELAASDLQRARLQAALARARVDAEVAQAESEAMDRRLVEMTALLSAATANGGPRHADQLSLLLDELTAIRRDRDHLASQLAAQPAELRQGSVGESETSNRGGDAPAWPPLSPGETEAQATFLAQYSWDSEREPGRAGTSDHRGRLVTVGGDQGEGPTVDVVVCVHNALEDVRTCLWSLLAKTSRRFSLIVVDDGSDPPTADLLAGFAAVNPAAMLIQNPLPPHGYTIAANLGMRASKGQYVILLNSDTIVTPAWLERIVAYGEAHPEVGVLGPLSNAASHQSVPELRAAGAWATNPLPSWLTPDGVAMLLERAAPRTDTRLPFINGFCYAIKRQTLDVVGPFDEEHFATGYCEENDFSHRARLAGFELAVVDDAYVYHAKSRSFGIDGRTELARRHYEVFVKKHGRETIQALVTEMEANVSLSPVRAAISDAISGPQGVASALAAGQRGPLSIVFVLPGLGEGGSGGSHSIYQEVRGLRQLGIPARIALAARAWERAKAAYDDADELFETFVDADELFERTRDADVISATHFKSVSLVQDLYSRRHDFVPAYYIQDYEPFFTAGNTADRDEAVASYTAVPGMRLFAKTHWLCNVVGERHGVFVAKVVPSIDERLFQPSGSMEPAGGPLKVCAMIRPRTPRRQPQSTIEVLERVIDDYGDVVEVTTFGCSAADLRALTTSEVIAGKHRGILKRESVAALLGQSHVFLDMSMYQAFGRTALEAMACGCIPITPQIGGTWEFLEDGVNGLSVDTLDRPAAFAALAGLVHDRDRIAVMRLAALTTGARYSVIGAALSEYLMFDEEHRHRFAHSQGVGADPTRSAAGTH